MATTAANTIISNTNNMLTVHTIITATDTNEGTMLQLVDKSALVGPTAAEPTSLRLLSARWCMTGFSAVKLLHDHGTSDTTIMHLCGNGYDDFVPFGGIADAGTGSTGDPSATTVGASATATADITLVFKKEG